MVLARWIDLLLVVLVVIVLIVVVYFGFVWDPAAIQNIQTCPVHAPGQTPWPQVPPQCLAGW